MIPDSTINIKTILLFVFPFVNFQDIPIAGLSISTMIERSANDYRQVQIVQQQKQQQTHNNRIGRLQMLSTTQPLPTVSGQYTSAEPEASSTQSISDGSYPSKCDSLVRKSTENHEPKSPASISNIGGAILRSKTADFEKMSVNKQHQQKMLLSQTIQRSSIQDTTSSTTTTIPHLYKRQELIQSAKNGSRKK